MLSKLRRVLMRGVVFIAPLGLSAWVLGTLYSIIDGAAGGTAAKLVLAVVPHNLLPHRFADGHIPGASVLIATLVLGGLGTIASFSMGQKLLRRVDGVLTAIPALRTIYAPVRKMFDSFGDSAQSKSFQKVVFVDWPAPGMQAPAFVTNEFSEGQRRFYFVFIPCMPNPTSGFMVLVEAERVTQTDLSVEEALKLGFSFGRLIPPSMSVDRIFSAH